jgi:tetratricopeptide (TPR) repeat protein
MMKAHAKLFTIVIAGAAVALLGASEILAAQEQAGSGRARVLVATFQTADGVDDGFGEDIAEELREEVDDFDLLVSVEWDDIDDALGRFDLDHTSMDLIQWRQLASRLNAQLLIFGDISGGSAGNQVNALFVETRQGEETEIPTFSVQGDDGDAVREVSSQIAATLDEHVSFLSARLNCQDYLSSDQFADAVRNCDRALEIRPNSTQALYLRGQIAVEQESWDDAIEFLKRALEQSSDHEEALQSLAYAHAQAGNMERATELYRDYLEFNPADQDVRLTVAYNLANAGAYPEAMSIIRDGLDRDSTSAALWKYLGDVAIRQGTASDQAQLRGGTSISDTSAIETALQAYRKFSSLQPDSADVGLYRNMIGAQLQLEDLSGASETVREALDRVGSEPALWSLQADIRARQDDLQGAISAMDSVLALDSEYRNANFKRGVFKLRSGDTESAMADFERSVESGTDPGQIAQQLFATGHNRYFKNGENLRAARMFEAALEFSQEEDLTRRLHFWSGYSYFRRGRELDSANEEAQECQPARQALDLFEQVMPHINRAGDYQQDSQQQIAQAVDVLLYRQEQIQKKSC